MHVGDGRVRYETEVRAVQAKTARGVPLPSLYEINRASVLESIRSGPVKPCAALRLPTMSKMNCSAEACRSRYPKKMERTSKKVDSSGYLLLEVLLALAILSMVVVMIFQIIQTTLKATADINYLQTQQRKVDGICELLRRNFYSMPRTCLFQTRNNNGSLELIFRYAPFSFSWVHAEANFGTVVIASRPQPDGRLALSVLQESGSASNNYLKRRKGGLVHIGR